MNEIICYLNSHTEIQQVAFLVGEDYKYSYLKYLLDNTSIKKLVLVGCLKSQQIKNIKDCYRRDMYLMTNWTLVDFEYIDVQSFNGLEGRWTLCCDRCYPEILFRTCDWKPECLLATIWQGSITAFKIWEKYKTISSYIQIKTLRCNKEPQMLVWEKDSENDIELSVIFPMYNVANYLEQCISSVSEWKAPYIEFLFVNDGSPDNSREIVLKWAEKDSRIKLLDKTNGGCASARQYGLDRAKGRYIGFIDPDDFIDESMFRKLLRTAMTGSYDISYCGYNEYYEDTKETKRVEDPLGWPYCDGTTDVICIQELMIYSRVAIWRGIYKAEMLKKNNIHFYTDIRRFDDLPFKIEVFAMAKSVIAVPEHLYYYRLARPGQDVSADDERLYVHFDIFEYLNSSICATKNARLVDYLQICKIQTHLYALETIKEAYKQTYSERAKKDLESLGEVERSYKIAKKYIGEENANFYKAIVSGNLKMINLLKKKDMVH